ncbi:hypothetical protein BX600DRAFT_544028 [Xylariales sp. PMI_506]|nr:hypothetical protein BX600DRAFT_544028 [Xylariales sp. PMI_506]
MVSLVSRFNLSRGAAGKTAAFPTHTPETPPPKRPGHVSDLRQPRQTQYNDNRSAPFSITFSSDLPQDRPAVPPKPQSGKMDDRPSTSGGPSSKKGAKSTFNFDKYDKRISRDDLYLDTRPGGGSAFKAAQYGAFRSQLPTPEESPKTWTPGRKATTFSPGIRVPTPDSMVDPSSAQIGMALGSPSHAPTTWAPWQAQATPRLEPAVAPPAQSQMVITGGDQHDMPRDKKQSGKWKLFGMFGRKHTEARQPPASVMEQSEFRGSSQRSDPSRSQGASSEAFTRPGRSNTTSASAGKNMPKHKPIVIRSQTMPITESPVRETKEMKILKKPKAQTPSPDPFTNPVSIGTSDSGFGSIPIVLDNDRSKSTTETRGPPTGLGLLNVDIPKSDMERYSVMFGELLQKEPAGASALLARRQATLRELKTIREEKHQQQPPPQPQDERNPERPRRATSPNVAKASPAFALFPQAAGNRQSTVHGSPRITRANTSPAMLPSPSRTTFATSLKQRKDISGAVGKTSGPPLTIATLARARDQHPQPPPREYKFGPEEHALTAEFPSVPGTPQHEVIRAVSVSHKIQEPQWEMVSPSSNIATSVASSITSSRKRSPSSISSTQTHLTKPSVDMDDSDPNQMNAVEISIARQISLSRQQRQLLKPLETSFAAQKSKKGPPVPIISVGKNERLAETKTSTPTLVTPDETSDSQYYGWHRKSERIVVEGS